jgi:hypothetical protein
MPPTHHCRHRHLWHPWPGRGWPLGRGEEQAFVERLSNVDGPQRRVKRHVITALLGGLRGGLGVEELCDAAPGVKVVELRDAYLRLEQLRQAACTAWEAIQAAPTVDNLRRHGATAAGLVGVPIHRLAPPMEVISDRLVADRLTRVAADIGRATGRAHDVEAALAHFKETCEEAVELGRILYDPYRPSMWTDPYFLPDRVGSLSPVRVAALLGEHSEPDDAPARKPRVGT